MQASAAWRHLQNTCRPCKLQMTRKDAHCLAHHAGDDRHTVHIWRWLVPSDKVRTAHDKLCAVHYAKAMYIPSWHFGPEKKLGELQGGQRYFCHDEPGGPPKFIPGARRPPFCFRELFKSFFDFRHVNGTI